jgi:hypothetical protein
MTIFSTLTKFRPITPHLYLRKRLVSVASWICGWAVDRQREVRISDLQHRIRIAFANRDEARVRTLARDMFAECDARSRAAKGPHGTARAAPHGRARTGGPWSVSNVVSAACWPLQMSPTQKAVLMALADNASDHGVCWPSIPTLCIKTCLAKSTVITALQALESAGLLVADRATGRVNKYQIVPTLDLFPKDKPVRQLDRSGSRTGTGAGPNPSGSRTGPVREPDPNHKEPSRTIKKEQADLDLSSWPSTPNPQVLADWLDLRRKKRAPITETALRGMGAQLHRAAGHRLRRQRRADRVRPAWLAGPQRGLAATESTRPPRCTGRKAEGSRCRDSWPWRV